MFCFFDVKMCIFLSQARNSDLKKYNLENIPSSIEEFFTPEEYAKLCDYQKLNYRNLRQNYEMLRRIGKRNFKKTVSPI